MLFDVLALLVSPLVVYSICFGFCLPRQGCGMRFWWGVSHRMDSTLKKSCVL